MSDMVPRRHDNVVPLSKLRAELAEAKAEKSLPRLQRVIGAATVAAEAQRRVARLADGEGSPAEIVDAAREGSRQAATVQLEATAAAGRLLREMAESGQRQAHGQAGARFMNQASSLEAKSELPPSLADLGVPHANASRWQKVGAVSDEIREEYVEKASAEDQDITVAGLLRYANPKPEPKERTSLEASYDDAVRLLSQLLRYDSAALAGHAGNTKRRTQFRKLIEQLRSWADKTDAILT